jgi:hypothetical protein
MKSIIATIQQRLKSIAFTIVIVLLQQLANAQTGIPDTAHLLPQPDFGFVQPGQSLILDVLANDGCGAFPDLNGDGKPDCPALKITSAQVIGTEGIPADYITKNFILENQGTRLFIQTQNQSVEGEVYIRYGISGDNQRAFGLLTLGIIAQPAPPVVKKCWTPAQLQCPIVPNCGLICNSSIGQNYLGSPNNLQLGGVPHWTAAQGTPNTSPGDFFGINCGVMGMWRHNNSAGEAAYTQLNQTATPGNVYLLTYTRQVPTSYAVQTDQLVTRLGNSGDFTAFNCASNSGLIFNDPNIAPGVTASVGFGFIPSANYTHFGIYPRQTTNINRTSGVVVDDVELMAYPPLQSFLQNVECCKSVKLTPPSCHNRGTIWEWYEMPSNTLVHSGDATFLTPPVCKKVTYELRLRVLANIVGGLPITYSYTLNPDCPQDCCPCDDAFFNAVGQGFSHFISGSTLTLVPNGGLNNTCDKVIWTLFPGNINIGTTYGSQTLTYSLPSGNGFGICMTVIRTNADGKVCEKKVCRDFQVPPPTHESCCKCDSTFYQAVQNGFNFVQISSLTYVFNVNGMLLNGCDRVTWDFGDGSPQVTTTGNASAHHVYASAGAYTVCIKVVRVADDGTVCDAGKCITRQLSATGNEETLNYRVSLQPNPFVSSTLIRFGEMPPAGYSIEILDIQGRVLRTYQDQSGASVRIEREGLSAGTYFYRVISSEGASTGKMIVAD